MKKLRWLFLAFALVGTLEVGIGAYLAQRTRGFLSRAETAPGVVVENVWSYSSSSNSRSNSGTYHPRVRFRTAAGRDVDFVSDAGSSPPSHGEGEEVTVVYDPADPGHASIRGLWDLWAGPLILCPMGIVFALAGLGPMAWMRRTAQLNEWLRSNGQRIVTDLQGVELNQRLTVNGVHPYRIVSQWLNPATNRIHVFHSESIWYDPGKYVTGDKVAVWIDPKNPKRYVMETEFLPKMAE